MINPEFTNYHLQLLMVISSYPGSKHLEPTTDPKTGKVLWPLLEEMGFIRAVGGWKWEATEAGEQFLLSGLYNCVAGEQGGGMDEPQGLPERMNENEGNSYATMQALAHNQCLDKCMVVINGLQADLKLLSETVSAQERVIDVYIDRNQLLQTKLNTTNELIENLSTNGECNGTIVNSGALKLLRGLFTKKQHLQEK